MTGGTMAFVDRILTEPWLSGRNGYAATEAPGRDSKVHRRASFSTDSDQNVTWASGRACPACVLRNPIRSQVDANGPVRKSAYRSRLRYRRRPTSSRL